jgi:hypothetical protein
MFFYKKFKPEHIATISIKVTIIGIKTIIKTFRNIHINLHTQVKFRNQRENRLLDRGVFSPGAIAPPLSGINPKILKHFRVDTSKLRCTG